MARENPPIKFVKYHALGNDYIVINPADLNGELTPSEMLMICDRHYGIGSDGVLLGPLESSRCDFKLKIFNPDASEAEKSGNGLRLFSRYLWDQGLVTNKPFSIETKGGDVRATVHEAGKTVSVDMGRVTFTHESDLVVEPRPEEITINNSTFEFYRANVGNPHCVIPVATVSSELAKRFGPIIEKDSLFSNRTNIQFLQIISRNTVKIEIWERGAGYTLASGSSSTASAGVAFALGLCDEEISVHMPGGILQIAFDKSFKATMTGPVCNIGEGIITEEALKDFEISQPSR